MKKRDWFWALSPLFATWLVDRFTKILATQITEIHFYGPLGFVLHHNHGAIMGLFSSLPAVLRVVSLSTGGAFLLFIFALLQFMLPTKSLLLRSGLSFLIGGIIGNVTDRIAWGYVVDFIIVGSPQKFSPAFNLADALQWVGYFMIVAAFIKEGKALWPAENLRKTYWINIKYQLKYCVALMVCGFGLSAIAGTYSYTYLRVTLNELRGDNPALNNQFLIPYILTFLVGTLFSSLVLFVVGMILSHRAAGPVYAFERFLNARLEGKSVKLKLRTGDEFKELEALADKINSNLK